MLEKRPRQGIPMQTRVFFNQFKLVVRRQLCTGVAAAGTPAKLQGNRLEGLPLCSQVGSPQSEYLAALVTVEPLTADMNVEEKQPLTSTVRKHACASKGAPIPGCGVLTPDCTSNRPGLVCTEAVECLCFA